jgi:hypothetical protein
VNPDLIKTRNGFERVPKRKTELIPVDISLSEVVLLSVACNGLFRIDIQRNPFLLRKHIKNPIILRVFISESCSKHLSKFVASLISTGRPNQLKQSRTKVNGCFNGFSFEEVGLTRRESNHDRYASLLSYLLEHRV